MIKMFTDDKNLHVCACIYVRTYIQPYIHACRHDQDVYRRQAFACAYMHICTYIHTYIHADMIKMFTDDNHLRCVCVYIRTYIHTNMHTCMQT